MKLRELVADLHEEGIDVASWMSKFGKRIKEIITRGVKTPEDKDLIDRFNAAQTSSLASKDLGQQQAARDVKSKQDYQKTPEGKIKTIQGKIQDKATSSALQWKSQDTGNKEDPTASAQKKAAVSSIPKSGATSKILKGK